MEVIMLIGAAILFFFMRRWLRRRRVQPQNAFTEIDLPPGPVPVPRMDDGLPYPGEAIELASKLFDANRLGDALDMLERCRNECAERELDKSVQRLSSAILDLRNRRAAEELSDPILGLLKHHPDGIVQTELYKEFPDHDAETLRFACWRLNHAGKIERSRRGRSYLVKLAEAQDIPN